MKWAIILLVFVGFSVNAETLPVKTNNWMSVQGVDKWLGLSTNQIHSRQLKFISPEYGIRAGAISIITRALRKNNTLKINLQQIFFDADGWAEDKESYKLDAMSKGFDDNYTVDVMDREQLSTLINFISVYFRYTDAKYDGTNINWVSSSDGICCCIVYNYNNSF